MLWVFELRKHTCACAVVRVSNYVVFHVLIFSFSFSSRNFFPKNQMAKVESDVREEVTAELQEK